MSDVATSDFTIFGQTITAGSAPPTLTASVLRHLRRRGLLRPATLTVSRPFRDNGVLLTAGAAWSPAGRPAEVVARLLRARLIG